MAIGVLVLGESGTGKTYSIKNFKPDEVKILSVVKPILPFRGKYDIVKTPDAKAVIRELKNTDKKNIVIDDFQYILGLPMMKRIGEKGWEKFNEIEQGYSDVLDALNDLPDETIVYLNSHIETDDNGKKKIKTVGKALDKYITVEGLFMIVLGTEVVDDHYYFVTQNSGNDTIKSPEGMFPSKFIPNDLKYVEDKIRNYYFMEGAKTDTEIAAEDQQNAVKEEDVKPKRGRRGRSTQAAEPAADPAPAPAADPAPEKETPAEQTQEPMPWEEQDIPEKPAPRRRKERALQPSGEPEKKYYYIPAQHNVVAVSEGAAAPEGGQEITKEQWLAGSKEIATKGKDANVEHAMGMDPIPDWMNVPEGTDTEVPFDEAVPAPAPHRSRRRARS